MRKKPEILAPAGSFEGVRAAVQNGADAVYMGFGRFNARRNARNFDEDEIRQAIAYCRARNVKTHITVNTLPADREYEAVLRDVQTVYEAGADALIVQDLGLVRVLHRCFPDIELHGSTQMTIHTLDGALQAKALGMSRVVLSRELSLENIEYITRRCGIETEVFLHGALCMCYSGQCYLSAVIGQRSGNRGLCAQPCRLPYRFGEKKKAGYPLSLKDLSLLSHLQALQESGVASLKIEGRMKRPEYTAIVTKIYRDILWENREPTREELETLRRVFSRNGFTDGYFTGQLGQSMFGTKTEIPLDSVRDLYQGAAQTFAEGREQGVIPLKMRFSAQAGKPMTLTAEEGEYSLTISGEVPEKALRRAVTDEEIGKNLEKLGGTVWKNGGTEIILEDGLSIRAAQINQMRRQVTEGLMAEKIKPPVRRREDYIPEPCERMGTFQGYTVQVRRLEQLTPSMRRNPPVCIYVPLTLLGEQAQEIQVLLKAGLNLCPVMPRIYGDHESEQIENLLCKAKEFGFQSILVGNVGQIKTVKEKGFAVIGDFGLNVFNSAALFTVAELGIERQTLSMELRLAQIRDLKKHIPTELIVYGYLPLMIFENCVIRNQGGCKCRKEVTRLTDRRGKQFTLLPAFGCRNEMFNSQPVYFGSKSGDYQKIGVDYGRIYLTSESPEQCEKIYCAITDGQPLEIPEGTTFGLYYRGVE